MVAGGNITDIEIPKPVKYAIVTSIPNDKLTKVIKNKDIKTNAPSKKPYTYVNVDCVV